MIKKAEDSMDSASFSRKSFIPFLTFSSKRGILIGNRDRATHASSGTEAPPPGNVFSRHKEFPMKDKSIIGFIVIDILLAAGVVWGLMNGYKLLGYGLLVYFVINTLALVLKLAGGSKDKGGDQ